MGPNGMPAAAPPPFNPNAFRAAQCEGCRSTLRRRVEMHRRLINRLNSADSVVETVMVFFCVGCGEQITVDGRPCPPDDQFYVKGKV